MDKRTALRRRVLHGGNFELKFYLINLALFFCSSEACRWVGMASGFIGGSGLQESLWGVQEICPWIKWGSRRLRGWVFLIFFHKWAEGCSPEAVCPSWRLLPPPPSPKFGPTIIEKLASQKT